MVIKFIQIKRCRNIIQGQRCGSVNIAPGETYCRACKRALENRTKCGEGSC